MRKRIVSKILVVAMMGMLGLSPAVQAAAPKKTVSAAELKQEKESKVTVPKADMMDVDFSDGTAKDNSEQGNTASVIGKPEIKDSSELHKKIASFDGSSAYKYAFDDTKYGKMTTNATIECMFKYNSIPSGESDIFSNQQSGGLGLGLNNGKLTFFAHVGGGYRQPTADIQAGQWVHAVGVVEGTSVKIYVNGELKGEVKAPKEGIHFTSTQVARSFMIGADSSSSGGAEYYAKGSVSFARLYSSALSEEQVQALSEKAFEGADLDETGVSKVNLNLVASDTAAESGQMNVNLHANTEDVSKVDKITFDVAYDSSLVTYAGVQHKMSGVTIDNDTEGKLSVTVNKTLAADKVSEFSTTRLGKLNFRTRSVKGNQKAEFTTSNFKAYVSDVEVTKDAQTDAAKKTVTIYDKDEMDLNGDGVVGAGDIALAKNKGQKEAIAQKAAIYPYKHAVILTVDGGGQIWNPDEIYYTTSNNQLPKKTSDAAIMAKRKNTYAMNLINKDFAVSYTAKSVTPSISAQNYSSILHGVPWADVSSEYQVTNTIAGQKYYADYGKSEAKYPSVFKAIQEASPQRENAAFAEWTPILNGIIEPDAAVIGKSSASKESFYDVAKYIQSSDFNKTALVYMQSDWMDHVGHSSGYYNDKYWSELAQYDDYYKAVMEALEESGHEEDTLIVTNADHGGSGTNHGSSDPSNMDIFIGIGGQTVDSGKRLSGGTNADISPVVLDALRIEKPSSMTGKVFDQSAFLSQDQMSKKHRDVEKVTFERQGKRAVVSLSNKKEETKTADMVIDLDGNKVKNVQVPDGAVILRNTQKDGKQYLTIDYKDQPSQMATITFEKTASSNVKINEIMLGTEDGDEIYSDLENKQGQAQTQVALSKTSVTIQKGKKTTLTAKLDGETVKGKDVTWKSSNEKIAVVDADGNVTAKGNGTAVITAYAKDGSVKSASCKVTVPYEIKYVMNHGTNAKANKTTYYNQTVTLQKPSRKGYAFKGWYTDSRYKHQIKTIKKGTAKNYTVYAKWSKIKLKKASISSIIRLGKTQMYVHMKKSSGAKGYVIKYSTNKKFKKAKYLYTSSTGTAVKKLSKNKKYYVKVRAYTVDSAGKKVFGAYSKTKTKSLKK